MSTYSTPLPPSTNRPYAGEDDYAQMRALLTECLRIDGPPVYATAGDLDWWRACDPAETTLHQAQLWFIADRLAGFAWPDDNSIDIFTLPRYRALEAEMLAWAEQRYAATRGDDARPLRAWADDQDTTRRRLLEERGYVATQEHFIYWTQPLPASAPPRPLPSGYSVRSIEHAGEFAARVEAHRSAFAPSRFTLETYLRLRSMPGFRPEHDIVAIAPDGSVAAFCVIWYDGVSGVGLFEPVGTHAAHQQRGLGRAVLAEGLRRLAAEGAHTAIVLSHGGQESSARLYQSAGFRPLARNIAYDLARAGNTCSNH